MLWKLASAKDWNYVNSSPPFWYTKINKKAVIVDEEATVIRDVFDYYVEQRYSAQKIAEILTKQWVLTKYDKVHKWEYRKKNPMGYWTEKRIRDILQNTHYKWEYYYNKKDNKQKLKDKSEWQLYNCSAIVTPEIFDKAQVIIEENKKISNNAKYTYLYSSKIRCWLCGSAYTWYVSGKNTKNYRCLKNNKSKSSVKCDAQQISEILLDEQIWPCIEKFL